MSGTTGYAAAIDTNDIVMSYAPEQAWGTIPALPFQDIRLDAEGFTSQKTRVRPNEINPTGQASGALTTQVPSTGSINFSASAGTHNDFIASSLGGVFGSGAQLLGTTIAATAGGFTDSGNGLAQFTVGSLIQVQGFLNAGINTIYRVTASAAGTITTSPAPSTTEAASRTILITNEGVSMSAATIAATGTGFTDSGNGFVIAGIVVGQMIKVAGFTTTGVLANAVYRVQSVSAGTITTTVAPGASKVAGDTVTIVGAMCRNGTTFQSFILQKKLAAALFLQYPGTWWTGGTLDVKTGGYFQGTLSSLNQKEQTAVSDSSTGVHMAAPNGLVINSVGGISNVLWNSAALSAVVQAIGVKWTKTGARAQFGIGSSAAQGMGKGKLEVTGNLTTYFKDFTLYTAFINETSNPLSFQAMDNNGKGYVITFCNATIMNPKIVAGGPSQDIIAAFNIEGNPDTSGIYGGQTIQIDYFYQ